MKHFGTYWMNLTLNLYILLHTGLACDHLAQLRRVIRRSPKKNNTACYRKKWIIFIDLKGLSHEMDLAFYDMHG
jgi:hypothetical protein